MKKIIHRIDNPQRETPIPREELLSKYANIFESIPGSAIKGKNTPVNVFGILLKSPEIAALFFPYWSKSKTALHLSVREQELIILKIGCYFGCDYIWGHHVPILLETGATQAEIDAIPFSPEEKPWSDKEKILLIVSEELVKSANITEKNWKTLTQFYTTEQILDIITVASQYLLFSAVNNTFGVKLEHPGLPNLPDV